MSDSKKLRVNISITEKKHQEMKALAMARGISVSQLVENMANDAIFPLQLDDTHTWLTRIPSSTLEKIEQYAAEHHTSPEQALTDWIWNADVTYSNLRGQMSLF